MSLRGAKKARNKNQPKIKCEICNLELHTFESYLSHTRGKKHQRKESQCN